MQNHKSNWKEYIEQIKAEKDRQGIKDSDIAKKIDCKYHQHINRFFRMEVQPAFPLVLEVARAVGLELEIKKEKI